MELHRPQCHTRTCVLLVLFTGMGEPASHNHIGVEEGSTEEVAAVIARTRSNGMEQEVRGHLVLESWPAVFRPTSGSSCSKGLR